ncbi:hypothetical protein LOTGIDRAFT_164030 [Lottia gigantea]|uniref:Uncharacterized protein n=1 Tax=Lottia gigantea TaxID=225164 RepID=V4BNK9_LOTGI|nr:hypothetical protein LOTGIDRAFT_164030 [Lottia gigantea]ESO90449.1 hypothetical protein LOTGIDRAFT_164030 [Lottia gigantea]
MDISLNLSDPFRIVVCLFLILIVAGDIEQNPGPTNGGLSPYVVTTTRATRGNDKSPQDIDIGKSLQNITQTLSDMNDKFEKCRDELSEIRGVFFTPTLCWTQAVDSLSQQARKASGMVISFVNRMIVPILCYGAAVWGYGRKDAIEKCQLRFLKAILHNMLKCVIIVIGRDVQYDSVFGGLNK